MSSSATALLAYAAWTLLLVSTIGVMRSGLVLSRRRAANSFQPDGADVSAFSQRLCRVHANCVENLPVAAAIILLALATNRGAITDPLALWLFYARLGQSLTHLLSTSSPAVLLRFTFFLAQLLILAWWIVQFVRL